MTTDFEAFKADVEALGVQRNEAWERTWQAAREAKQKRTLIPEGEVLSGLPQRTGEIRCTTRVVLLPETGRQITPRDDCVEERMAWAA